MNIAIIIAAGSGHRMGQDIPKQFINVYDRPVLEYTLENFQKHPEIDEIVVVCLEGWQDLVRAYANQFNITKCRENYVCVDQLPRDADFFFYQNIVNRDVNTVPSHCVIEEYIAKNGMDYRYETAPNPIPALRDRTKDNTSVGR